MLSAADHPFARENLIRWIRFHSEMSDTLYSDTRPLRSGADAVDGERYRLVAAALRSILGGISLDEAISRYRLQWKSFAAEQNAKVDAAPKLKLGPSSGQSVIGYKVATPSNGEQGELDIRRHYHDSFKSE